MNTAFTFCSSGIDLTTILEVIYDTLVSTQRSPCWEMLAEFECITQRCFHNDLYLEWNTFNSTAKMWILKVTMCGWMHTWCCWYVKPDSRERDSWQGLNCKYAEFVKILYYGYYGFLLGRYEHVFSKLVKVSSVFLYSWSAVIVLTLYNVYLYIASLSLQQGFCHCW